ncbi:hypothetical protein MKY96_33155 [Paenibacillus sp. FSL R7-0302]|uniref:hypothetical protein n=1 Tax=Paenibacillus sp. FSL R7-0302 TaxID=2921681 RepID=UPI0030FAAFDC
MSFTDHYRRKLSRDGNGDADAVFNHTMQIADRKFMNSPNARKVKINGIETDVRVLDGDTSQEKNLLLRPNTTADIGSLIELKDSEYWLAFDILGEEISPKLSIQSCNDYLRWIDANGLLHEHIVRAAATRSTKYDIQTDKMQVEMLVGGIYAYVQANEETKTITSSQRFILGGSVYEVAGVDDVSNVNQYGKGVLQITCKLTTRSAADDFTLRVADNSQLYKSVLETNTGGNGGDLW